MANITLSIDPNVVKRVRRIALERNTTLTAMVRDYLRQVAARDDDTRERAVAELKQSFDNYRRNFGPRDWTREDLYDR